MAFGEETFISHSTEGKNAIKMEVLVTIRDLPKSPEFKEFTIHYSGHGLVR